MVMVMLLLMVIVMMIMIVRVEPLTDSLHSFISAQAGEDMQEPTIKSRVFGALEAPSPHTRVSDATSNQNQGLQLRLRCSGKV